MTSVDCRDLAVIRNLYTSYLIQVELLLSQLLISCEHRSHDANPGWESELAKFWDI